MTIQTGYRYQTRNGRVVVIKSIEDGGMNSKGEPLPPYGVGELAGEGRMEWRIDGSIRTGNCGVPSFFDLAYECGKETELG